MLLRPMQRIVFKFIWISVDGEIIENDTKTIVWTENILFVFGAKTPFSNLSGKSNLKHWSHADFS